MFNDFMTNIVVSLEYYHAVAATVGGYWVPHENLSWYSVLNISHKVTSAIKC